jgi:hypothetical protein
MVFTPEIQGESVICCGEPVPLDAAAVQQVMNARRLDAAEQAREWMRLSFECVEPEWMELCVAAAQRMAAIVSRRKEVEAVVGCERTPHVAEGHRVPSSPLAERHFVWLGADRGLRAEHLREVIANLAARNLVSNDRQQQEALRRGLGLTLNAEERTSAAPWVHWIGTADMLVHLINWLWKKEIITCAGGRQQKWRTATGVFLRADGTCYDLTLKNSCCKNEESVMVLDKAVYAPLRMYMGSKAVDAGNEERDARGRIVPGG